MTLANDELIAAITVYPAVVRAGSIGPDGFPELSRLLVLYGSSLVLIIFLAVITAVMTTTRAALSPLLAMAAIT